VIKTKLIAATIAAGAVGTGIALAAPASAEPISTVSCSPCDRWTEFSEGVVKTWTGFPQGVADSWNAFPGSVVDKWTNFPGDVAKKWTSFPDDVAKKWGLS